MIGAVARRRHSKPSGAPAGRSPVPTGTTEASIAGTSGSITLPASTSVGDLLLLFAAGPPGSTPTTPSGWTLVTSASEPPGSSIGLLGYLFSKVAAAGDIGGSVTVSNVSGSSWPWTLIARSYSGTTSVKTSATAVRSTSPQSPASLTSDATNESLVAFIGLIHQASSTVGDTLNTGGSDSLLYKNPNGFTCGVVEDWLLPTSGSTSSGGSLASTQSLPQFVAISVLLTAN